MEKLILALETSCDETAVALVSYQEGSSHERSNQERSNQEHRARPTVITERIASQVALHAKYGGVVPELAAREHLAALPNLVQDILTEQSALLAEHSLAAIAVTTGPGLKGSLLMGVNFAKGFGLANKIKVVGVNHIEGHLLSPLMSHPSLEFPYLAVIVSGGHTELHEVRGVGEYTLIERTTDDAAGEAFDKSAALLGIPYPGGAELSRKADTSRTNMPGTDFDGYTVSASRGHLSFSGLKTSFRVALDKLRRKGTEIDINRASSAVQTAIVETLYSRVGFACRETGLSRLGVSGGVAANMHLRSRLTDFGEVFPAELKWCGDNAAMIGFVAAMRIVKGCQPADLQIRARWPVEEMSNYAS